MVIHRWRKIRAGHMVDQKARLRTHHCRTAHACQIGCWLLQINNTYCNDVAFTPSARLVVNAHRNASDVRFG